MRCSDTDDDHLRDTGDFNDYLHAGVEDNGSKLTAGLSTHIPARVSAHNTIVRTQ